MFSKYGRVRTILTILNLPILTILTLFCVDRIQFSTRHCHGQIVQYYSIQCNALFISAVQPQQYYNRSSYSGTYLSTTTLNSELINLSMRSLKLGQISKRFCCDDVESSLSTAESCDAPSSKQKFELLKNTVSQRTLTAIEFKEYLHYIIYQSTCIVYTVQ